MSRATLGGALVVLALAAAAGPVAAQPASQPIALKNPSFIADEQGLFPGWSQQQHVGQQSYEFKADTQAPHSPPSSISIHRTGREFFGLVEQRVPVPPAWAGKTVRLSGWLRTQGATGTGGALILQARNPMENILVHDHMDDRRVRGDQPWKAYSAQIKLPPGTTQLQVGVMMQDDGTLWADDLALELLD